VLGETGTRFHLILGHSYQELDFVQIGDAETMLRIVRELQQPISYFTTDRPLGRTLGNSVLPQFQVEDQNIESGIWCVAQMGRTGFYIC